MPAYDPNFRPPAPVALVTLHLSTSGTTVANVPMLLDTGADISLIPRAAITAVDYTSDRSYELNRSTEQKRSPRPSSWKCNSWENRSAASSWRSIATTALSAATFSTTFRYGSMVLHRFGLRLCKSKVIGTKSRRFMTPARPPMVSQTAPVGATLTAFSRYD